MALGGGVGRGDDRGRGSLRWLAWRRGGAGATGGSAGRGLRVRVRGGPVCDGATRVGLSSGFYNLGIGVSGIANTGVLPFSVASLVSGVSNIGNNLSGFFRGIW